MARFAFNELPARSVSGDSLPVVGASGVTAGAASPPTSAAAGAVFEKTFLLLGDNPITASFPIDPSSATAASSGGAPPPPPCFGRSSPSPPFSAGRMAMRAWITPMTVSTCSSPGSFSVPSSDAASSAIDERIDPMLSPSSSVLAFLSGALFLGSSFFLGGGGGGFPGPLVAVLLPGIWFCLSQPVSSNSPNFSTVPPSAEWISRSISLSDTVTSPIMPADTMLPSSSFSVTSRPNLVATATSSETLLRVGSGSSRILLSLSRMYFFSPAMHRRTIEFDAFSLSFT